MQADFKGDIYVRDVNLPHEESEGGDYFWQWQTEDEALLCLESPGGVVHGYGLVPQLIA